jgi:hypothetical protein
MEIKNDEYLEYFQKRNNYISYIIHENEKHKEEERIKNEKLKYYYITKEKQNIELLKEIEVLKDLLNKNKENYITNKNDTILKINNLKNIIYEYK